MYVVDMYVYVDTLACLWRSVNTFDKSILSFYHVGDIYLTHVASPGSK